MVHGGLPGPRLCWPSVKEKRKEECEAPLLLERSFSQNCHFSPEQSVSQRVRDCVRPAQVNLRCGCAGLDWEWWWWWWLVGGRVGETGRTLNTYWETAVTHSPTGLILSRTGGATGANILAKSKKRRVRGSFNSDCLSNRYVSPDFISILCGLSMLFLFKSV